MSDITGDFDLAIRKNREAGGVDPGLARELLEKSQDFLQGNCSKDKTVCSVITNDGLTITDTYNAEKSSATIEISKKVGDVVEKLTMRFDNVNEKDLKSHGKLDPKKWEKINDGQPGFAVITEDKSESQ